MEKYNKEHPLRVFEAFAGIGAQSLALERLKHNFPDFDYKVIGISEVEMNAIAAYRAIHGDIPNYGDISAISWGSIPDFDLFTYSFPCQSISAAGKQAGLEEGSGTRSSLLWECRKAIEAKRPRIPADGSQKWSQRIEIGCSEMTNTITSVSKDNLLILWK